MRCELLPKIGYVKKSKTQNRKMMNRDKKVALGSGLVSEVRDSLRKLGRDILILHGLRKASEIALKVARKHLEGVGGKHFIRTLRGIPIPRVGEILLLIPILAGLSDIGGLTGASAGITKVGQTTAKASRMQLEEALRHNKTMEAIALGKRGKGLYWKPFRIALGKSGKAIYLKPFRKGLDIYLHSKNY